MQLVLLAEKEGVSVWETVIQMLLLQEEVELLDGVESGSELDFGLDAETEDSVSLSEVDTLWYSYRVLPRTAEVKWCSSKYESLYSEEKAPL